MLTKVNSRFKTIVQSVAGPLPEIHISSHLMGTVPRYICVRRLVRRAGGGSGLVIAIKSIIKDPRWINAWLTLNQVGIGWYKIMDIRL